MAIITDEVRGRIQQRLNTMQLPVDVVVYGDGGEESGVLVELVQEMAELSDKIRVQLETGVAPGIEQVPALVFRDHQGHDPGIRYYGVPVGYEFTVLLDDLIDLGTGKTQLSARTKDALASVTTPTVIKVFVTPT